MKLHTTFTRLVGAGLTPALGGDTVPTGLPLVGSTIDKSGIVARCVHTVIDGNPVQRLALLHHYVGAGPAVPVPVSAYCYVVETDSWYLMGTATLTTDVVGYLDVIGGVLPKKSTQPIDPGDAQDTLEVVLIAAKPGGAPDGSYAFGALFDTSLDGGDATASAAAMLAELVLIYNRLGNGDQKAIIPIPGNYSTSRGDGTAVRLGNTTVTLTGPAVVSSQLRRVVVFIDATTAPLIWEQGVNSVLSISGTSVTVSSYSGLAAPVPATATLVVVDWVAQDKAFDAPTNAMRSFPVMSDRGYRVTTPITLIGADLTVTAAWQDVGPELPMDGQTDLRVWLKYTKGDGTITTLQVRALAKHTNGGTDEYPLPNIKVDNSAVPYTETADDESIYVSPVDASGLRTLLFGLANTVPWVQLQVKATTPGTTMLINKESVYTSGYGT